MAHMLVYATSIINMHIMLLLFVVLKGGGVGKIKKKRGENGHKCKTKNIYIFLFCLVLERKLSSLLNIPLPAAPRKFTMFNKARISYTR